MLCSPEAEEPSVNERRDDIAGEGGAAEPVPGVERAATVAYLQSEEWQRKNARRIALIKRKVQGRLSEEEEAELVRLQEESSAVVNRAHPLPQFDAARL